MPPSSPAVSVLMAVHNGEATLRTAIADVQAQSFQDWELLIIDDASTDSSVESSQGLAASDSRIRVITSLKNSGGPAAPRNMGIESARGEVMCLIDQDDRWHPRKLEAQVQLLKAAEYGLVYSDAFVERPGQPTARYSELWGPMAEGNVVLELLQRCFVPALTAAVPMSVVRQIGAFDQGLSGVDDYDYWLRIALVGYRVGLVPEPLATWVVGPGSLSHQYVKQLERLKTCLGQQRLTSPEEVKIVAGRLHDIDDQLRDAYLQQLAARRAVRPAVNALRLARGPRDIRTVVGVTRRAAPGTREGHPTVSALVTELTVAVVIPCYNYGHYLEGAIESALAQTLAPAEILVVNDGSLDDTAAVAAKFAPLVRCITTPNGGVSRCRNIGLDNITATHVVYLDADDRLEPNYLEACRDALQGAPGNLFAYTQSKGFGEHTTVTAIGPYSLPHLLRENFMNPTSMMPTQTLRAVRYDESLRDGLEDWELYLSLARIDVTGILVDGASLLYRHHNHGITANARRRPFRLARTKLRILIKHRDMYTAAQVARQIAFVLRTLRFDAWERGSDILRRRIVRWNRA